MLVSFATARVKKKSLPPTVNNAPTKGSWFAASVNVTHQAMVLSVSVIFQGMVQELQNAQKVKMDWSVLDKGLAIVVCVNVTRGIMGQSVSVTMQAVP